MHWNSRIILVYLSSYMVRDSLIYVVARTQTWGLIGQGLRQRVTHALQLAVLLITGGYPNTPLHSWHGLWRSRSKLGEGSTQAVARWDFAPSWVTQCLRMNFTVISLSITTSACVFLNVYLSQFNISRYQCSRWSVSMEGIQGLGESVIISRFPYILYSLLYCSS